MITRGSLTNLINNKTLQQRNWQTLLKCKEEWEKHGYYNKN